MLIVKLDNEAPLKSLLKDKDKYEQAIDLLQKEFGASPGDEWPHGASELYKLMERLMYRWDEEGQEWYG